MAASPSFLLRQIQSQKLWENSEWLAINHYGNQGSGFQSRIRGPFFLSVQGSVDPQSELEKTVQIFFDPDPQTRKKAQCKYLSRREFLQRHLAIPDSELEICEFSKDWLERLGASSVRLIFASAYLGSPASSFGHTLLKLHSERNNAGLELLDYGVNFAARTDQTEGALYAWYGLLGYFPANFGLAPYHQMIKEYVSLEGRDIWEYQLNLNPQEVQRLLFHLLELEGSYFDYYFLNANCSSQILELLEIARPGLKLGLHRDLFVIPQDAVKAVVRSPNLVTRFEFRPSLRTQFQSRLANFETQSFRRKDLRTEPAANLDIAQLELAQSMTALDQTEDFQKYQARQFEISLERSRRGAPARPLEIQKPQDPSLSEDSSQVGLGLADVGGESHGRLHFRPAFRELLSRESQWTGSHLEILSGEFDRTPSDLWSLEEFRLIKIQNAPTIDAFFFPKSWSFETGLHRKYFERSTVGYFEARSGLSGAKLNFLHFSGWLIARGDSFSQTSGNVFAGLGLQVQILWGRGIRSDLEALSLAQNQREMRLARLRTIWDLNSDFSVLGSVEEKTWLSLQETIKKIEILYSF